MASTSSSWGEYGTDPGQFNIVHNICCDSAGLVYVSDRENHRVQVFDGDGTFIEQWNNLHRACGLTMHNPDDPIFFVGELGPFLAINRSYPNLGPRVSVVDKHGKLLARLGGPHAGTEPGTFIAPHTAAVDSHGDLYVGEVSFSAWIPVFQTQRPAFVRSLAEVHQGQGVMSSKPPINRKPLIFFERFFDSVAEKILGEQDDIDLVKLRYDGPQPDNWAAFSRACAYQIGARTELIEPWFGNAALIARSPQLLAICSIGAGYDVIDVDACSQAGIIVCSQSGTNFEPVAEHAIGMILEPVEEDQPVEPRAAARRRRRPHGCRRQRRRRQDRGHCRHRRHRHPHRHLLPCLRHDGAGL